MASREICKACFRPSAVGFDVPDEVWERVKPPTLPGNILCLGCFTSLADELGVEWCREIEFFPISRAAESQNNGIPGTNRVPCGGHGKTYDFNGFGGRLRHIDCPGCPDCRMSRV